ncbi:hypothetical protein AMAG_09221 [Allomyces macrogynus ATCC 38327]|uniref:Uncharacterized protein n=1 Tax=Allomyces macrogynus (strain ATCC 38327) TaxID=578462 RepID=A0A0L0SP61_ALLM3|nr:hypothetical protein AMAG_09221 [Allomyces macrogynus ATCC 38327]|eukprot:KNE64179.1 hypothetical protein AMAG_09221 [Allomyces macrogynus ATCC 38327]
MMPSNPLHDDVVAAANGNSDGAALAETGATATCPSTPARRVSIRRRRLDPLVDPASVSAMLPLHTSPSTSPGLSPLRSPAAADAMTGLAASPTRTSAPSSPLRSPPPANAGATRVISLRKSDKLRLVGFATPEVAHLIQDFAAAGIELVRSKEHAERDPPYWQLRVAGDPWSATSGDSDHTIARRLLTIVLRGMLALGWRLAVVTDLDRAAHDKNVLVFLPFGARAGAGGMRRAVSAPMSPMSPSMPESPTAVTPILCSLGIDEEGTLRLVDAPPIVLDVVESALKHSWHHGIDKTRTYPASGLVKYVLAKDPWVSDQPAAQLLAATVIAHLHSRAGFHVYCSIKLNSAERTLVLARGLPWDRYSERAGSQGSSSSVASRTASQSSNA